MPEPVPCVRVARADGEATRQALADRDLIDGTREIEVTDDVLYIPVTDPSAVGDQHTIVERAVPRRRRQSTPADLLGFEPAYERLGEIVILDEDDPDRARTIAAAVMDSDLPCETVVNRASKVQGQERVREWTVLAGDGTETVHREYGHEFLLDLTEVYFSPRLATERHRVTDQVSPDERAFDMFAGVGPFAVPMAARGAETVAVDVNPRAVQYLRENARRNGVTERLTAIGGDVRTVAPDWADWADRIVMNLPHSADSFLDVAVELAAADCTLHYYDIQHEDDPFGPGEAAIRAAAADTYDVEVLTRREVRSYAPHELNVCLDVRLTRA